MPKDQKDKFSRILESAISGLSEFASVIDDLSKQSTMMLKLLNKSIKELKSIKLQKGTVVVEEQPEVQVQQPKIGIGTKADAREKAASLLFNMLSTKDGSPGVPVSAAPITAAPSAGPPRASVGPPKAPYGPPKAGPPIAPSGPPKAGPPIAPSGPPKAGPPKSSLPPPPKLPPISPGAAPPAGPSGIMKAPTFTKSPVASPPMGPPGMAAPPGVAPPAAASGGGGSSLGSLRDEMLKELDRLKKIMRGG